MDAWGSLVDYPTETDYDDRLEKFKVACSPWPMFVDYVKDTWLTPHRQRFVKVWTDKVMHLGNTTTNRVESAHWTLKRLLQNSIGDLCSVWDVMNNMITLQHSEINASYETSTHVVGHAFKVTLYKRLLGMVSRYALNEIAAEFERVNYAGIDSSRCGCILRSTHGLPCACELARYVVGAIPLDSIHMFWRRLSFSDQGLCEPKILITQEIQDITRRFKEVDVCGKVNIKSKLREIAYPDLTSICAPPEKVKTKGGQKKRLTKQQRSTHRDLSYFEYVNALHSMNDSSSIQKRSGSSSQLRKPNRNLPMLDQFHPCIQDFITDIVDVKADGNCGYHVIAALLGLGEDSWSIVHNHLLKELRQWRDDYIQLLGGIERYDQIKWSIFIDGLSEANIDKWMNITDMGYMIASRYNVILISLSLQQSMTFFPLRSQPPTDCSIHRILCIGHVYGNHFVQVFLKDGCPLPPTALLWATHCYSTAKQWSTPYISRMHQYCNFMRLTATHVDLGDD